MLKYILPILLATGGGFQVPPATTPSRQYSGVGPAGPIGPQGLTGPQGPSGASSFDGGTIQGPLIINGDLIVDAGKLIVGGQVLADGGLLVPSESTIDFNPADGGNTYIGRIGNDLVLQQDTFRGVGKLQGSHWRAQFDLIAGTNTANMAGLRGSSGADVFITSDWSSGANEGIDTAMNGTGTFQVNGVEVPVTPTWVKDSKQAMVQGGTKACASSAYNITFADAGGVAFSATPKWCTVTDEQGSVFTITVKTANQLGGVCVGTDTLDWQCWGDK